MERRQEYRYVSPFRWYCLILIPIIAIAGGTMPISAQQAPGQSLEDPLEARLLAMFEHAGLGRNARLGIYVVNLQTGVPHVSIRADEPMRPASLLKIVTSAAALDVLGPDHRFVTTVGTSGRIDGRTLHGDVVIRGGGDASLGPRFQQGDTSNVTRLLDDWATELRRKGIRTIRGNILGDGRRYTGEPIAIGWDPLELGEWYSAEVSALGFNDNCVDVIWRGSSRGGRLASYRLVPDTGYIDFSSSVRSVHETDRPRIRYFRFEGSNEIRARGRIAPGAEHYGFTTVHDPARYTAHLFMETLERRGINVVGSAFNRMAIELDDDPTTEPLVLITHESAPFREFLPVINGNSQNLYAEVAMRETALAMGHPGSFTGGVRAVNQWLRRHDLQRNGLAMVDGSGLSPVNRMPPRQAAEILRFMHRHPHGEIYKRSLAVPGNRSMRNRFRGGEFAPIQESLYAKTGYIEGVHSMAGYLTHKDGGEYLFVVMLNDYDERRSERGRELVEELVFELHQTNRLP